MAILNSWQKLDRVLPGTPFGNGSAGNVTISSDPNTRATASGSATSTSLTIGSAILSNGDVFVIHQTQGTGVTQWEINRASSGGGTTSITCQTALQYTYGAGAQVIKFPLNDAVTLGNFTQTSWDGSTGGVTVVCGKTSIGGSGTVTLSGNNGATSGSGSSDAAGGIGRGFNGGNGRYGSAASQGVGTGGAGAGSKAANGNGGGGGNSAGGDGGGGGGNSAAGGNADSANGNGGAGGAAVGAADLTTMSIGGGGGGSRRDGTGAGERGGGGAGGGIIILISKAIDISSATITANGGNAGGTYWGGGGGAGGSGLIVCKTAVLGTNKITATAGAAVTHGGNGSVGRIAVHHSGAVTGTTNPTFTDQSDPALIETNPYFLYNLI